MEQRTALRFPALMTEVTQNVTVKGSGNQVIVAGGDVHYTVTCQLPEASAEDRRNLLGLLALVRQQWLAGVLDAAVKETALLELGLNPEPQMAVERPWTREREAVGGHSEVLPPGPGVARVFEDAGRTLLILGGAGAGKTITLLTLAREWADRAERDPFAAVPVVFNLSSWGASRKSIHDWMVHELAQHYGTGRELAVRWLKERRLLLLMDGLDEVAEERRAACVEAIHDFVVAHGVPGLAVCCRRDEYRALPVRLSVGGAVTVLPLTAGQVDTYVQAAGDRLAGVRRALGRSAELRELAESPLMLHILSLAFGGVPADALRFDETSTREELREQIFGRFVDRMFTRRWRANDGFSRAGVEDGLRWLALGMKKHGSIFAVELLQPAWLAPRQLLWYMLGSRAAGAAVVTVAIGAVVCLAGVMLALAAGATAGQRLAMLGGASTLLVTLGSAVGMGVLTGLFYAPLGSLTLRRFRDGQGRQPGMAEELGLFFGYLALSGLAALLVIGMGGWGLGLSLRDPPLLTAFITLAAAALSLPVLFGRKAGRGSAGGDISLAGTLSWRWRAAVEMAAVCAVAGGMVIPFAHRFGLTRAAAGVVTGIVMFTLVAYGSWRQEVPPVDRWRDGGGSFALRHSGRVFAFAALACVLALFPLLALAMGPQQPLRDAFGLAVLTAIVLFSPALFWFGGIDLVLHATLRLVLSLTGTMPLRLRRFLDYAVHLGFLQRAGGGYIFFHRLLLEHFAARPAPAGGSAAKEPGFLIPAQSARPAGP